MVSPDSGLENATAGTVQTRNGPWRENVESFDPEKTGGCWSGAPELASGSARHRLDAGQQQVDAEGDVGIRVDARAQRLRRLDQPRVVLGRQRLQGFPRVAPGACCPFRLVPGDGPGRRGREIGDRVQRVGRPFVASTAENPPRLRMSSSVSVARRLPSEETVRVGRSRATEGCARSTAASEPITARSQLSGAAHSEVPQLTRFVSHRYTGPYFYHISDVVRSSAPRYDNWVRRAVPVGRWVPFRGQSQRYAVRPRQGPGAGGTDRRGHNPPPAGGLRAQW